MGGKTGTTTSTVSIPPEVMARYNAVNAQAQQVASTPFQPYTGQFVAGLTPTQQAGIQATSQYSQTAQPYYQAATGQLLGGQQAGQQGVQQAYSSLGAGADIGQQYAQAATQGLGGALQYAQPYQAGATQAAMMGAQGVSPQALNIGAYMSPYTQAVADATYQALRQQQQQDMQGATANAIRSGAFGGDRAGLVAANLARQQQLGTAQAMAPIYQQGYGQALAAAQQQQGVQLTADQANRAALQNLAQQLQGIGQTGYAQQMGAAQQLAGLGQQQFAQGLGAAGQYGNLGQQQYAMGTGTAQQLAAIGQGAQQSALQGAQAQLGAGTLEQQTQQADLTARYQQFLQERGYPFQVAQFLANIAMGTGALSGQTTTTQQPMPFFSDRRVKHDVKEIGETHDGQPIYSFKYNGSDHTQIGLMAQDVEKKHPEAVYDMGGVKGVDYKQATENAERKERYEGGLVPASMGGVVTEPGAYERGGYYDGGSVDPNDIQAILAQQQQALGPFGEKGIYGQSHVEGSPFGKTKGIVPQSRLHIPKLMQPKAPPQQQLQGIGGQALDAYDQAKRMYGRYEEGKGIWDKLTAPSAPAPGQGGIGSDAAAAAKATDDKSLLEKLLGFADGGAIPRGHFVKGGTAFSDPYSEYDIGEGQVPEEVLNVQDGPELPKTNTPQSQSGSGLSSVGTLVGLGKTLLSFLPLKDGGVVPRHGYATKGFVYDPTQRGSDIGNILSTEMSPVEELNKEDVYSKGLNPAVAPRFRQFEKYAKEEGAAGIKPGEMERSAERSALLDLTMPEGAPRAKPYSSGHNYRLATDYEGVKPSDVSAMEKAAAKTGLTLGAKFSNPDLPHVQFGKGSYGKLAPEYGSDVAVPPGFGEASHSGVVPDELRASAYDKARTFLASKGISPESPEGKGAMANVMSYLRENQAWLAPLGAGLRGMVQSRSPFLGGALLEGVGTGLEAIAPTQKSILEQGQTAAMTEGVRAGIPSKAFNEDGSVNVIDEEGNIFSLDPAEFQIRRRRGEKITYYIGKPVAPTKAKGLAGAAEESVTGTTAPSTTTGATTQPAAGAETKPGQFTINDPMALNTQEQQGVQKELQTLYGKYPTPADVESMKKDRVNLRDVINSSAEAAELQRRNITYADILSSRGQKGIFVGGPLAEQLSNLASVLNQASLALNGNGFRPDQNATIEDAGKLYSQLVEQAQRAGDGKTLGQLQNVAKTYPYITASNPGSAKTMSEVIVQSQEPLYKAALAKNLLSSTGSLGQMDIRGEYVGGTFENTFRDKFSKIATEDKKSIEKLLSTQSGLFEKDEKGLADTNRPISMFSYLARQNQIPASVAKQFADKFANGDTRIFWYFPNLRIIPD